MTTFLVIIGTVVSIIGITRLLDHRTEESRVRAYREQESELSEKAGILHALNARHRTSLTIEAVDLAIAKGFTSWESLRKEVTDGV